MYPVWEQLRSSEVLLIYLIQFLDHPDPIGSWWFSKNKLETNINQNKMGSLAQYIQIKRKITNILPKGLHPFYSLGEKKWSTNCGFQEESNSKGLVIS